MFCSVVYSTNKYSSVTKLLVRKEVERNAARINQSIQKKKKKNQNKNGDWLVGIAPLRPTKCNQNSQKNLKREVDISSLFI